MNDVRKIHVILEDTKDHLHVFQRVVRCLLAGFVTSEFLNSVLKISPQNKNTYFSSGL